MIRSVDLEFSLQNLEVTDLASEEEFISQINTAQLNEPLELFQTDFGVPINQSFNSALIDFDYSISGSVGLELDIDDFTLGNFSLDYPISSTLILPDAIQPGQEFVVGTGNDFFSNQPEVNINTLNFGRW